MGMMPGMGKMQKQMDEAGLDDRMLRRQVALINSMTKKERRNPDILQASRKKRIAAGAGLEVAGAQPAPEDAPADGRRDEEAWARRGRGGLASLAGKLGMGMPAGGGCRRAWTPTR